MKKILIYNQNRLMLALLAGVFIFNLVFRLYSITSIPSFVVSDEIQYISEARSLAISGKDLTGTWSPWQLTSSNTWYAELTGSMLVPAAMLFWNNPMVSAKFTHILMGSLLPFLLAGISFSLFKNKKMAIATVLVATFNPWLFQFSRLAFDPFVSIFFYTLGMYIFLMLNGWKKLVSILPFFLGFYQYQAHKVLLFPFVLILTAYVFYDRILSKDRFKIKLTATELAAVCVLVFSIVITAAFIIRLPGQQAGGRQSQLTLLNKEVLSTMVNEERRMSLDNPWQAIFTNKGTVFFQDAFAKYFGSYNPVYLFSGGGGIADSWTVTSRGKFYILDVVLIILGLSLLHFKQYRKGILFIVAVFVVAPFPAMLPVGPLWATFRSSFIMLMLMLLAGAGLWYLSQVVSKKMFLGLLAVYFLLMTPFFYDYFYRFPLYSLSDEYFYDRVMASYLKRLPEDQKALVLIDETRHAFLTLLFYNGWLTKDTYPQLSQEVNQNRYVFRNLEVRGGCFDPVLLQTYPLVLSQRNEGTCDTGASQPASDSSSIAIASIIDSGEVIKVSGDTFCSRYDLPNYSKIKTNIFDLEKLSDADFCQNFFIRYR